ncbi:hypothetical protein ACHAXR_001426, partial [Thalassiosira sp. AJA248-18]
MSNNPSKTRRSEYWTEEDDWANIEMDLEQNETIINDVGGTSSFATSVFNLANNVAGSGLLTLPAGKAAGAGGWIPSVAICCTLAYASSYTFILIGHACEITGEQSFKGLWATSFGPRTTFIVDACLFINCTLGCAIYVGLMGDIFSSLLNESGLSSVVPSVFESVFDFRSRVILGVAGSVLFPLNLVKNMSALSFTSLLGLGAIIYTVVFMVFRALDGSYSTDDMGTAGKFVDDGIITQPSFDQSTMWNMDLRSLVLVSNFGLAFIAHYNAPSYYREMNKSNSESFPKMVRCAYLILAIIYASVMCAGYYTFGDTAKGNILLNYHPRDVLAFCGQLSVGFSLTFGYPLVSNGAREGLKNVAVAFGYPSVGDRKNHILLVIAMLMFESAIAILVKDIKIIAGFSGAVMGSFLVYICPPLLYWKILKESFGTDSIEYKRGLHCLAFVPFGIFICIMGVVMTY